MNNSPARSSSLPTGLAGPDFRAAGLVVKALATPTVLVAMLVLAAVSGLLATQLPFSRVVILGAGLAVFLLSFSRPEFLVLLLILMSTEIIDPKRVPRIIPGFSAVEILLMFLLGLVVVKILTDRRAPLLQTHLDLPLMLFFGAITLSYYNAQHNFGPDYKGLRFYSLLVLTRYLVFFVVTRLITTRRQLMTLVNGMLLIATLVAALMTVQQMIGTSMRIIPGTERVGSAGALGQDFVGVVRTTGPAGSLVYVMLLPVCVLYVTPRYALRRKWLLIPSVILMPLAIAFTFTRGMWLGALAAIVAFIIIARGKSKDLVVLTLVWAIVAALLVPLVGPYYPKAYGIVEALTLRARSLVAGDELVFDGSTQGRLRENELAMAKIVQYPILGIGPGGDYRLPWYDGDDLLQYVHNAYLYLLLDVGILGFLPFLWLSAAYLIRGFLRGPKIQDAVLRSLVTGFTLSYVAILVSSSTSPRLVEANHIPLLGVLLAINEVAFRIDQSPRP